MKNIYTSNIYAGGTHPINEDDIEEAVATKQDTITGAATTITDNNLTANRALTSNSNGKVDVATTTTTELNYVHGVTSAIQTQLNAKASTALDNLSSDGQMIIDSANGTISNCILEIPQNIKASITSNVITLAKGSILTNTGSTYATTTTTTDQTYTISGSLADGSYLLCSNGAAIQEPLPLTGTGSGSSLPADGSTFTYFYNTTDKLIYKYADGSWSATTYCYPICLIKVNSGAASFAKDSKGNNIIFNGVGFIGHHIFRLPNVSGYSGEGFTDNGKLNSNYYKPQNLLIRDMASGNPTYGKRAIGFQAATKMNYIEVDTVAESPAHQHIAWVYTYVREQNQMWVWSGAGLFRQHEVSLVYYEYNGTTVTDFTICQPYEGARCLLTDEIKEATKQADVTTLTGYDATKTQTLKNVSGVLTWVDDE
jgi:hypothetical protein